MLIFTNRVIGGQPSAEAFAKSFRQGSDRLGLANIRKGPDGAWLVEDPDDDVDDADSMRALLPLFQGARPVLVYLHGNNNTPAKCFERCAKLELMYDVEVVGFSWPSEGSLPDGIAASGVSANADDGDEDELAAVSRRNRTMSPVQSKIWRYHQAKTNAQHSVDALARFFRMLGTARLYANKQPFTIAVHSLGAHYLQYMLTVPGATEAVTTAHNIALLAPCVRSSGHRDWLSKVQPKGQLFIAYNKADTVLAGARIADGDQIKLCTEPTDELVRAPYVRYISFSNAEVGAGGHGYFVNAGMPKKMKKLFGRVFSSKHDLQEGEDPRQVYLVGCDKDGLICYMGAAA